MTILCLRPSLSWDSRSATPGLNLSGSWQGIRTVDALTASLEIPAVAPLSPFLPSIPTTSTLNGGGQVIDKLVNLEFMNRRERYKALGNPSTGGW